VIQCFSIRDRHSKAQILRSMYVAFASDLYLMGFQYKIFESDLFFRKNIFHVGFNVKHRVDFNQRKYHYKLIWRYLNYNFYS